MNGQFSCSTVMKDYGPEKAQAAERRKQEAARVLAANPPDVATAANQVQAASGPKLFSRLVRVTEMDKQSQHVTEVFGNWEESNLNPKSTSPSNCKNGHGDGSHGEPRTPSHGEPRTPSHDPRNVQSRKPPQGDSSVDHRRSIPNSSSGSQPVHPHHQSGPSQRSSGHKSVSPSPASRTLPSSRPPSSQDGSRHSGQHRNHSPSPIRNHGGNHVRHSTMPSVGSGGGSHLNPAQSSAGVPSTSSSMTLNNHSSSSTNPMTSGNGSGSMVSPHHSSRPCNNSNVINGTDYTSFIYGMKFAMMDQARSEKASSNSRVPPPPPNGALVKGNVTPVKRKDGLPKLKMPDAETPQNENIDEILKEMTHIHPPLTGIDTPHKTKANFPFPSSHSTDKTPPAAAASKTVSDKAKDMEEDKRNQLIEDLSLSDDSEAEELPAAANNVEPENGAPEKKGDPVNMDAVDSSREDNMSSSSDSSSEESDSTDSSGSDSSSENGEDDDEEEEEKEKSKPEVNIAPLDEKPQQKSWGLKSFMVTHTPPLNFNLPPMVPEKKPDDTSAVESAPQKAAKASEETSKGSGSSAGAGRKSRDANRSTTVPFSPQEPEEFLVKELGLGQRGNGVPTPEDARPADKAPASVASLQSPSTTSEGSTSSKKASSGSKQKTPRSRSSPGSAKAQESQHKRTPSTSSAKNSTNASSSNSSKKESSSSTSSKNGASSAKTTAVSASVSTPDKKTSSSSKTKGSRGKTKPKSRQLISDSDSDSETETSSVVTATNKASSSDKKSVVSERDLIAMQLFSGDSSSPTADKQEEAVKSVSAPKEKSGHGSSKNSSGSKSSKTTNHKKREKEPAAESNNSKASEKKSSSSKRGRHSSSNSKSKDSGSSLVENPPFKPPEPLSPLPQSDSGASREQTYCPSVGPCPGPLLNSKDCVWVDIPIPPGISADPFAALSQSASHSKTVMPSPRQPSKDVQGHHSKTPSHRPAVNSPAESKPSIDGPVAQQPSPCGSHASSSSRSSSHKHKRSRSKNEHDSKECSSAKQAKTSSSSRSSHKSPSSHTHSSSSSSHNHRGSSSSSSSIDKRKRPHSQSSSSRSSHSSNGHSSNKRPCSPTRTGTSSSSPAQRPHASPSLTKKPKENQVPQENGLSGAASGGDKKHETKAEEYLQEAKTIKRQADSERDPLSKLLTYTEALVEYIKAVQAMVKGPESALKDYYTGVLNFIKHINKIRSYSELKGSPEPSPYSKKLAVLTLKTAASVSRQVYKFKKSESDKYRKVLDQKYNEMFQQSEKSQSRQCFPSPQANSWTSRMGNIPSPSSPAPSPAGSTASLGSQGSNDMMPRNNGSTMPLTFAQMGSTITLPTRIFQIQYQDYQITTHLVLAHEYWDQASAYEQDCKDFFETLDRECGGPLLLESPIDHLVNYIGRGVRKIRMEQSS